MRIDVLAGRYDRVRRTLTEMQTKKEWRVGSRVLDVDLSMGGFKLDLSGEWVTDSEISIDSSMGGGLVVLPRDVFIEGVESRRALRPGEEPEVARPTLRFTTSSSMGDLQIRD